MESSKKKTAELSEKLKERIRQHEKLQYLYEALRRKFISPSFFAKQNDEEKLTKTSKDPFVMSTASGKAISVNTLANHLFRNVK